MVALDNSSSSFQSELECWTDTQTDSTTPRAMPLAWPKVQRCISEHLPSLECPDTQ